MKESKRERVKKTAFKLLVWNLNARHFFHFRLSNRIEGVVFYECQMKTNDRLRLHDLACARTHFDHFLWKRKKRNMEISNNRLHENFVCFTFVLIFYFSSLSTLSNRRNRKRSIVQVKRNNRERKHKIKFEFLSSEKLSMRRFAFVIANSSSKLKRNECVSSLVVNWMALLSLTSVVVFLRTFNRRIVH